MPGKPTRDFGNVRKLPSGRYRVAELQGAAA